MAVRAPGEPGYVPPEGFPPDVSGAPPFRDDVDLPWWEGGGKGFGFGPGGFPNSAKLTAPASGPAQGLSLSTAGGGATPAQGGPSIFPPTNSTIPSGKQVGAWTNPFTDAHINPATGQPEMLTGPGGLVEKNQGGNPLSWLTNIYGPARLPALAGAGIIASPPADTGEFHPAMITGRPDAPWGTTHGLPAPATATPMPARPVTPTPSTAYPAAPAAAGPAATRQRPNLGTYAAPPAAVANSPFTLVDRPNMSPQNSARGHQGAEQMGMLDLSRLFGGGQPAPAAAAPASILARPRPPVYNQPSSQVVPPGPEDPSIIARQRMRRRKSSSTSEGGGFNQ